MMTVQPTARQREIEQSFVCTKPVKKAEKKHYLKGDVIKAHLLNKGLRVYDLAERLSIGLNSMYNRMQGVKSTSTSELNKICKFLEVGRTEVAVLK